ncbi:MAG TPA: S8 family serine peptidase [Candidatus Aquicultor sp.]|jgi:subtilisin family serine protease
MPSLTRVKPLVAVILSSLIINCQMVGYAAVGNQGTKPHTAAAKSASGISASKLVANQVLLRPKRGVTRATINKFNEQIGVKTASTNKLGVMKVSLTGSDLKKALATYNASDLFEYAEPNYKRKAADITPNDTLYSEQWGLAKIGMPTAWGVASSSSNAVKVAILDTGVDTSHEDLQGIFAMDPNNPSRILGKHFYSDVSGRQLSDDILTDNAGHGTHIAGIIAAVANNSKGIAGIASAAKIMPVKILDDVGYGDDANIAQGIIWAADNGAHIVNMSLAGPAQSRTLADAIKYAHDKGVVVVAATGNEASSEPNYPAAYDGVIGVGATDTNDTWVPQSNFGNYVDVTAPGMSIISTFPPAKSYDGQPYEVHSGTSMAAGFVSGLAALLCSINPNLTNAMIEGKIYASADDLGTVGWDRYFGYGRINAARAVSMPADSTVPVVRIAAPAGGITVSGKTLNVIVDVSDASNDIAFVDFFVNGQRVGSAATFPYSLSINTTQFTGRNSIRAVAYDKSGNSSTAETVCYQQTFRDVPPSYWAFDDIEALTAKKVLSGYPGGEFKPANAVGRAEYIKMLMEGMGLSKKSFYSGYFKDVPKTYWAWPYIEAAHDMGLITGYSGKTFSPESRIKRVEMATILIKTGAFAIDYSGDSFADVTPSYWGYAYVMSARNAHVINGYPGNMFRPEQSMNRAEAARVIQNAFFNN